MPFYVTDMTNPEIHLIHSVSRIKTAKLLAELIMQGHRYKLPSKVWIDDNRGDCVEYLDFKQRAGLAPVYVRVTEQRFIPCDKCDREAVLAMRTGRRCKYHVLDL